MKTPCYDLITLVIAFLSGGATFLAALLFALWLVWRAKPQPPEDPERPDDRDPNT